MKPEKTTVYVPFEAVRGGGVVLRQRGDGFNSLDIFRNRRSAKKYLQAQERVSGKPLRLEKLKVAVLIGSINMITENEQFHLLTYEDRIFPLKEDSVIAGTRGPWDALWKKGETKALSFATSWWWLNYTYGNQPEIGVEIVEAFFLSALAGKLPEEALDEMLETIDATPLENSEQIQASIEDFKTRIGAQDE